MADSDISLGIKITADGANANAAISTLTKNIEKVGDSSKKAAAGVDSISQSAKALSGAAVAAGKALAAMGAYFSVRQLAQTADAYSNLTARIKLVSGTTEELVKAQKELFALSQRNMTPLADTVNLYSRLAYAMRDMGRSQTETIQMVDLLGKSLRISGASAGEMASVLQQLSQALGGGVLRGEEFNALRENGQRTLRALADGLGVTVGQLKNLADQGKLTSDVVTKALLSQADTLKREYETIPVTISGAFQQISNAFSKYIGETDQTSGASRKFAESLTTIAKNMDAIMAPVASVTSFIVSAFTKWADAVEKVKTATAGLRELLANVIPDLDGMTKRHQVVDMNAYATGGGFGGANDPSGQKFFDGVDRSAQSATQSLKGFNEMQRLIYEASIKYKLDPAMMLGLAQRESNFNPKATNPRDGGRGLFQFMPGTWRGVQRQAGLSTNFDDAYDPKKQVDAAMRYMTEVKRIVWNSRSMADLVAAWNYGPERMVRAINKGRSPESVTTKGHVPNVMKNASNWQQRISNLPSAELDAIKATGKEIEKYQEKQYKAYAEGLKQREKAYDDYSKVALAKNKTLMDELASQQQAVSEKSTVAVSMGDIQSLKQAEAEARQLILDRNKATVESIGIEEKAIQKRLGNIGMEIAAAKQLKQFNEVAKLESERSTDKANLQALAETRKQLEIQTNNDLLQNARQYAEKRLQLDKGLADANVAMAQERRQAEADALQLQYQAAEFSQNQLQANIDDQKAAIEATVAQTRAQIALNEEQRAQALEGKSGLEAIAQQRENINGKLRDALVLIQAEKQAALDKLNLDAQMLEYEQQIAEWKKTNAQDAVARLQAETAIADIHAQQAANAQKYLDVLAGVTAQEAKARTEATKSAQKVDIQDVREQQLRENAFWDQLIGRAQEYARVWGQIGENSNDAFATMMVASDRFIKNIDQISKSYDNIRNMKGGGSFALDMAEGLSQLQNGLNLVTQSMLVVRDQYEKGTDQYKKYDQAAAAVAVAAKFAAVAEGILAVVHQMSSGDPYSAIPRALAVAAMLASMGISTGASGGGTGNRSSRQETQGTGTVLGDSAAQSQSISESLSAIKENTSNELNYSSAMLRAMEDLNASILALANNVAVNVMPAIDEAIKNSGMQFGMTKISLFSGFNKQVTDSGIGWFKQSLEKILEEGFDAKMFADITRSFEVIGMTLSESTKTYVRKAGSEVNQQITGIFRDIVKAFQEGGKAFGLATGDILTALKGFKIGMEQVSLKDMTMQEQQEALGAVFSKLTDNMAKRINNRLNLQLQDFQQASEGMAKTFLRVSEGINRATGELEMLGMTAIDYTDIVNKQGDVAAEITRQSILAQAQMSDGVRQYIDELTGSAEDIIEAYKKLAQASAMMRAGGFGDANLNRAMINAAGGLDAFIQGINDFTDNFLSAGVKFAAQADQVYSQMLRIIPEGTVIPTSISGFRELVQSIDTTTLSGQKLFGQLIALSGAFADMENQLQSIREKYSPKDALSQLKNTIAEITGDFETLIAAEVAKLGATGPRAQDIAKFTSKRNNLINGTRGQEELTTAIADRTAERDTIQALIDAELKKPKKKQRDKKLKEWRKQIAALNGDITAMSADLSAINSAISDLDKQISDAVAENDTALAGRLGTAKAELIVQRGSAILQAVQDAWDAMTQGIVAAYDALKAVQDDILSLQGEITGGVGGKVAVTAARKALAAGAFQGYVAGGDMTPEKLAELSNKYRQAIMDEYNAKLEAINEPKRLLEAERDAQQKVHDEAIAALEKQLGVARELYDAVKNIQKYVKNLQLSAASTLSPRDRLDEAQKQYQELLIKAQGGDAKAMQEITQASDAYLEAAKQYFGSGTGYANIYDAILSQMADLGNMNVDDAQTIQDKIDALNKDHEVYLKGIEDKIAALHIEDQIKELQEATVKELQALQDSLNGTGPDGTVGAIEIAAENARKQMADLIAYAYDANLLNEQQLAALKAMAEKMGVAIPDAPKPETPAPSAPVPETPAPGAPGEQAPPPSTSQYTDAQIAEFKNQRAAYQAKIDAAKAKIDKATSDGIQEAEIPYIREWKANIAKWKAARDKIPAYARGGYASAGLALVGEEGPEIVNFERPAQVLTAKDTREALNGGGKTFAALEDIKREIAALVRTQAGANPEIITELQTLNRRMDNIERTQRIKP